MSKIDTQKIRDEVVDELTKAFSILEDNQLILSIIDFSSITCKKMLDKFVEELERNR